MVVGHTTPGYRVINYNAPREHHYLRLTGNTPDNKATTNYFRLTSWPATISNSSLAKINNEEIKDLSQAVELSKYTGTINRDTTTPYETGTTLPYNKGTD